MMRKRFLMIILALALALSGCQLAKPEAETQKAKDMLVGVFITEEYLNLFDMETWFQDNASQILGNKNLTIENPEQYYDRIWAEFTEDESGLTACHFPGLDGMFFASFRVVPSGKPENTYWSSEVSGVLCDVAFGHKSTDIGSELTISGTVYFSDTHPNPCLYFNPVYQTPDGDVYLLPGQGTAFGGVFGVSATHSLKEETRTAENGVETCHTSVISVTMEGIYPARSLVILQMDKENNILRRLEPDPAADLEELKPEENCAYILVEEHTADGVRRSLYQKEDRYLSFFRELENRMCIKVQIPLTWAE